MNERRAVECKRMLNERMTGEQFELNERTLKENDVVSPETKESISVICFVIRSFLPEYM